MNMIPAFKPFPEVSVETNEESSAMRIVTKGGDVLVVDTNCDSSVLERIVQCWNACRRLYSPAAHIEATDDYVKRLEQLRKDALASAPAPAPAAAWSFDMSAAPRDERLWLASECGKVIGPTSWDEKRGHWAGFATNGKEPIAWQRYVVPAHPHRGSPRNAAEAVSERTANQGATVASDLVDADTAEAEAGGSGQPELIPALTGQFPGANVSGPERAGVTAGETAIPFIDDCGSGA